MATRTPKKLAQAALTSSMTAVYTAPAATKTQITEIWIANTSASTARKISLAAHGTATANTIIPEQEIAAKGYAALGDTKIVLAAEEVFAGMVDAGSNETIITLYGIEEA